MGLTDAAKEIIERRDREKMDRWNGDRPMYDTAYTKDDFRLAEPGAEVWAQTEGELADIRMRGDSEPRGGIILEIVSDPDPETGDMRRAFRTHDYTAPIWQAGTVLQEHQIDPQSFTAPDIARLRRVMRRLCKEVAARRGTASSRELDLVQDAARLAAIIGQRLA